MPKNPSSIDVVLPISIRRRGGELSDLHRLKTLFTSAKKFWRGGDSFIVITPEPVEVRAELDRLGVEARVLHDDEVVPLDSKLHPWYRQQVIKLASHRLVETEFYLVLDSDCFFTRETHVEDLVIEGRGVVSYGEGPAYSHRNWYAGCRKLGLKTPDRKINVTPFLMNSEIAKSAFEYVASNPESIRKHGWSEYTLYHSIGVQERLWDSRHVEAEPIIHGAIWHNVDLKHWSPSTLFGKAPMSLVQSNTGVSAEYVWNTLRDFLI